MTSAQIDQALDDAFSEATASKYRRCLNGGMNVSQTATSLDVTKAAVYAWAKSRGETFAPTPRTKKKAPAKKLTLSVLSPAQREDYRTLMVAGYTRIEALTVMLKVTK